MIGSTDCMESGWVLVGVQGPRTASRLINLTLDNRKDEVCTSAHKIEELSPHAFNCDHQSYAVNI